MHKFPNLQSLKTTAAVSDPKVSGPTLIKSIKYAIFKPHFKSRILVRKEDRLNIFTEFMKTKNGCDNQVAHTQFLSEAGGLIRSLKVHRFSAILDTKGEASKSIDRLFAIFQLCPLLEECATYDAVSVLASLRKSKYPSLKKLSILILKHSMPLGFVNSLSLNLPNLCEFSFGFRYYDNMNTDPIAINMSHSSLDSLTWRGRATRVKFGGDVEVYIKLKTDRGLKYYSGNKDALLPVDENRYLLATQNTRFDINCRDLNELRIMDNLCEDHYSWIF
ncbi:hypothetical protein EDC94DRAFT_658271 [Helicostylum pulchrum]|nr:hypothetical protein EDC94DRAFT_658271 [Helicostylum pulchrum]